MAAAALAAYAARAMLGFGDERLFASALYHGLILAAAAACLARAASARAERTVWLVLGLGLASTAAAELY